MASASIDFHEQNITKAQSTKHVEIKTIVIIRNAMASTSIDFHKQNITKAHAKYKTHGN